MRCLILALAGVLFGCASSPEPAAEAPPAAQETGTELERARELVDAAAPFHTAAADPELSSLERGEAREQARVRLREARHLYDSWLDAHPEQVETLDSEYVRMAAMLYWIKKMAAANPSQD